MKRLAKLSIVAVIALLLLIALVKLYRIDSKTVQKALVIEQFFLEYCKSHNQYPPKDIVRQKFDELRTGREWYYWPNDDFTSATFQYPMTLPLPSAPGKSKFSEFFPVIYSYAVRNPCSAL